MKRDWHKYRRGNEDHSKANTRAESFDESLNCRLGFQGPGKVVSDAR